MSGFLTDLPAIPFYADLMTRSPVDSSVDFISVFHQAIVSALQESSRSEPIETISVQSLAPGSIQISVAGVIGLNSSEIKGSLSLQFPKETLLQLVASGTRKGSIEGYVEELTSLVLQHARASFSALGHPVHCALPNILSGKSLEALGNQKAKNWKGLELRLKEGVFRVFLETDPQTSEPQAPGKTYRSPKNWSAEALLEFVKAVRKTLEVQFSTRIEIGAPFKKTDDAFTFDVGSMIGVTDGDFSGYFGMYYQKPTFLSLMGTLLGTEFTELSEDIQDGASEITNICFGVAKQVLNEQGHSIQMALPYLIRGSGITSAGSSSERTAIAVPLSTPSGKFWIEFGYQGT
ncbi:hypothetical protein EB061_00140 [bacterium]|nr:hypothetical protein [bacterium]